LTDILHDGFHACRKARTCDQCLRLIQIGQRYRKQVYVDGGLQTYRAHEDCDEAVARYIALAQIDLHWDDPPVLHSDLCSEDYGWLLNEFPAVAYRFGIQGPVRP